MFGIPIGHNLRSITKGVYYELLLHYIICRLFINAKRKSKILQHFFMNSVCA